MINDPKQIISSTLVLIYVVARTVSLNKLIPGEVRMFSINKCRGIRRK